MESVQCHAHCLYLCVHVAHGSCWLFGSVRHKSCETRRNGKMWAPYHIISDRDLSVLRVGTVSFGSVVQDMISHFTENIYDIGIALSVSGGDPAPLVGHNAFLR